MINIWEYQDITDTVKIRDIYGNEFIGVISEIVDSEEESEEYGFGEDSIGIDCAQGYIGIPQSEIRSIEIVKETI